jgi:hypothetical protein
MRKTWAGFRRLRFPQGSKERRFRFLSTVVCGLAVAVIAVAPAMANTITFAQYSDISPGQDWSIVTSGSGCNTPANPCSTTISVAANPDNSLFIFVPGSGLGTVPVLANFTFSATSTDTLGNCGVACANGDSYTQGGYNGTFSYVGAAGSAYAGVTLLSATFTGAIFGATVDKGTGGVSYSGSIALNPGNLTMFSQVLNFSSPPQTEEDASWTFSSVNPLFTVGTVNGSDQAYPSATTFNATGAGTFATQPGFVAEPDSLALTSLGFGLCGLAFVLRRFRSKLPLAVQ